MAHDRTMAKNFLMLAVCATACFVPTSLFSVPAGLALLLFLPGVYALRCCRPVDTTPGRYWLAIPMSLIVMGLALSWVWQWSNDRSVLLLTVLIVNAGLILARRLRAEHHEPPAAMFDTRRQRWFFSVLLIWIGACVSLCYWLPPWRSVVHPVGDYVKHHAICWSLDHAPLPLQNIFFAAVSDKPCYYYDQFYFLPAAIRILAGRTVSIPFVFGLIAGIVAITFVAMVYLIASDLIGSRRGALLAACCASIVGGWDIVPSVVKWIAYGRVFIVLDAWCPVTWRIHNIMDNFFWCPQHEAAVMLILFCCRLLQINVRSRWWLLMAPLAALSVFGTSVYHAMIIFPAATAYAMIELYRAWTTHRDTRKQLLGAILFIGVISAVAMLPRALHYREMNARYDGGLTLQWERFPLALFGRLLPPGPWANWLDAPWMLMVDVGLGALACVMISRQAWSRLWQNDGTRLLLITAGIGLVTMWLIRSSVNPLDYGFRHASRAVLIVGALCAGMLLQPHMLRPWARRCRQPALIIGILLGLPVGLYQSPMMAMRSLIESRRGLTEIGATRYIRQKTQLDAVVQCEPEQGAYFVQLTDRRSAVADPDDSHVNVFRPADIAPVHEAYRDVEEAFRTLSNHVAYEKLRKWGVTHVLIGHHEQKRFGSMPQFDNAAWFEKVYDDQRARVYRLRAHKTPTSISVNQQN